MAKKFFLDIRRSINKRNVSITIFLLLLSIYFVISGIYEYKSFLEKKENFIEFENIKIQRYSSYKQYGAEGPRLLYQNSPINIFFDSSSFLRPIETSLDSSEIIKIIVPQDGKSIFTNFGYFKGFSDFIFFFGSLFVLFLGLSHLKSQKYIDFIGDIRRIVLSQVSRLFLIIFVFFLLFSIIFLLVKLLGINFSDLETNNFFKLTVFSLLFLSFFYTVGLAISNFNIQNRKRAIFLAFVIWIIVVIFIPSFLNKYTLNKANQLQSKEKINMKKFSNLLDFDKEAMNTLSKVQEGNEEELEQIYEELISKYFNGLYTLNKSSEYEHINNIKKLVSLNNTISLILPTTFYSTIQNEISTNGVGSFLDFYDYTMNLRERFMKFYLQKRYYSKDKTIESFIKGEENVFRAESRLPGNFWTGVGITGLYCLILFGLSLPVLYVKLNRKIKDKEKINFNISGLEQGKCFFLRCRTEAFRNRLFHQLAAQPNVLALDKIKAEDIDPDLPPRYIVPYLCHIRGIKDIDKVENLIERLGVEDFQYFKYKKREEVSEEEFKKIYAALMLAEAGDEEAIILNNFLGGERRLFERSLVDVLLDIKRADEIIIYLSAENFEFLSATDMDEIPEGKDFEINRILLDRVCLR